MHSLPSKEGGVCNSKEVILTVSVSLQNLNLVFKFLLNNFNLIQISETLTPKPSKSKFSLPSTENALSDIPIAQPNSRLKNGFYICKFQDC